MFCSKCCNDLSDCTCPDLKERLASLGNVLIYKACKKCKSHYAKCKCEKPEWTTSDKLNQ
jgi:hypothetical protein